jgi:hypothetical protein
MNRKERKEHKDKGLGRKMDWWIGGLVDFWVGKLTADAEAQRKIFQPRMDTDGHE